MSMSAGRLFLLLLMMVGCDGVVGSSRVLDACGECGGDNSTCQIISGIFTEPYLETGYSMVVQIPAGACSIRIEEIGHTKNYLALRDSQGDFIINGDWNIDLPGAYDGAGASFTYHRQSGAGETISAQGPITQPVDLILLYRQANRGIKYEYAIKRNSSLTSVLPRLSMLSGGLKLPNGQANSLQTPAVRPAPGGAGSQADQPRQSRQRDAPAPGSDSQFVSPLYQSAAGGQRSSPFPSPPAVVGGTKRRRRRRRRRRRFQWVVTGYTECSKSCGGGTQTTEVVCMKRKRKQLAPDRDCDASLRPQRSTATCNTRPCPARWQAGAWSACSVTCGSGQQTRPHVCVSEGDTVSESLCLGTRPPPDQQKCQAPPCEGEDTSDGAASAPDDAASWSVGVWSPCSVSCGWGSRSRTVTCPGGTGVCAESERPRDSAPCRRHDCRGQEHQSTAGSALLGSGWMFTEWGEQCSAECGRGVQWRQVTCRESCDENRRPEETRPCKTDRRCAGTWFSGPWDKCSHECGWGVQRRAVLCVSYSGAAYTVVSATSCAAGERPSGERRCGGPRSSCPARWHTSEWDDCAGGCGDSWQSRRVACLSAYGAAQADCADDRRPKARRSCLSPACNASAAPPARTSKGTLQLYKDLTATAAPPPPPSTASAELEEVGNSIGHDGDASDVTSNHLTPMPMSPMSPADSVTSPPATDPAAGPSSAASAASASSAASAASAEHRQRTAGRRHRQRKHRQHHHHHHRPAADQRHSPQRTGGTGTCIDRFYNCHLVQQARLCKYKYYRNACCETCKRKKKH